MANDREMGEIFSGYTKNRRIVETDPAGFVHWDTPTGRWWIPRKNEAALFWDLAEQSADIYGHDLRSGDIVLDAGAKLVIAIEPAPENLECLRRNFKSEIAAGNMTR